MLRKDNFLSQLANYKFSKILIKDKQNFSRSDLILNIIVKTFLKK
jgi:hypothetical protein